MRSDVTINKLWWEHLAPKPMIPRRREVEALLNNFIRTSPHGEEWIKVAKNPNGIFRVKPGQVIPVVQLTFLGKAPGFVAPFKKVEAGHRTVGAATEFQSGKLLEEDELVLQPIISIDLVTDPLFIQAARQGRIKLDESQITQPSLLFSIPAHFLLSSKHFPKSAYVLYQHIFGTGGSYPNDGFFYVGVTTRSWQKRWSEHKRAINGGSPLLFHRTYREEMEKGRITYVNHKVMGITDDLEKLYATEEFLVEGHWEDQRRLNMIPGGKSGLRYLRENRLLQQSDVPVPDERDRIISEWLKEHPRKGLPAPWVAEKWRDNDWAVAQICGRDGRLSVEQVRAIHQLAEKYSPEEIFARIGAKNIAQVERVLEGKTYSRVE
ncbi:hypothetical protein CKQ84_17930 [Shewanella sp. WE21]|jgi:hypothetical protein|uniref:hypothetical protein n=1 Tax=Shewanella TaxID=22 RepID=UPI000CF5DC26|nr:MULTISPECIES: hypothetical protein [Shewanella]AVI67588.1 hypothetical protein CKQ84_17930 [Shewanella sp. WE21]MCS6234775.1 hypothetical protein [Shewanella baltica]MCS6269005.1 hypothetical protein [Shewanella baltica]